MPTNGYMLARALGERLKKAMAWLKRQPVPEPKPRSEQEQPKGGDEITIGPKE